MKVIGLDKEKNILRLAIKKRYPALLIGETGLGKTYLLRNLAQSFQRPMVRVPLNGEVGINELLGKWLVRDGSTYWQDGVLVDAMRTGKWILLDELNAALPEVLFCLNALLDDSRSIVLSEKDGEKIEPHENFRLFATMNPTDEYAGTKETNKALLSRFIVVLWIGNYPAETEKEIIKYQSGVDDYSASILVDVANQIRKLKKEKKIWYTCSVRDVISWGKLFKSSKNLAEAFLYAILNKAESEERELLIKTAEVITKSMKIEWDIKQRELKKLLTGEILEAQKKYKEKIARLQKALEEVKGKFKDLQLEVDK